MIKLCQDCDHNVDVEYVDLCCRENLRDPVDGYRVGPRCRDERKSGLDEACGPGAKFFKSFTTPPDKRGFLERLFRDPLASHAARTYFLREADDL